MRISGQHGLWTMHYVFFWISCKNFSHFILSCICFTQMIFFSTAPWMIYDFLTPHPTRLHKEQRKTSDWAKLKKKKSTFSKSRFHLGFSQITVFYSPKVLLHSKVHPISARIPLFPFLCCQHTTINLMFGPQWCPGMSSCPDTSPFPPVNFAVGLHKWPH